MAVRLCAGWLSRFMYAYVFICPWHLHHEKSSHSDHDAAKLTEGSKSGDDNSHPGAGE